MPRRTVFLLAVLTIVPFAFAQNTDSLPPLIERVEVHVVNVDVTVTDSRGNPVTGLKQEDFEVYEDGVKQSVSNFSAFTREGMRPQTKEATTSEPSTGVGRRIVLLVDNNYIDKVQRDAALRNIDSFIDKTVDERSEWAVASIAQRVEMLQSFTSDKAALHAALEKARNRPTMDQKAGIDRALLSDIARRNDQKSNAEETLVSASNERFKETVRFQAREQTWRTLNAVTNTARAVADMTHTYAAVEGRKMIVLLTGGIETNTSFAAYDTGFDREIQQTKLEISQTIDAMVREANAANFTVDVLHAKTRGMIAPQHDVSNRSSGISPNIFQSGGGNEPIDTVDVDSSALTIAGGTGGTYLTSNIIDESLGLLDAQSSTYYSLGYTPRAHNDYAYHRIEVKVRKPGVRVAHRQGYMDFSNEDRLEQVLKARLTMDQTMGSLPVAVEIGRGTPKEDRLSIPVTAQLPLQRVTMIPIDGNYVGRVHVYVSVFDADGNNVGFSHKAQDVKASPEQYEGSAGQFRYTVNVKIGKGAYRVLVTLRDELSNELGSAVQAVNG